MVDENKENAGGELKPRKPTARMNWVDKAIDYINPKIGYERRQYRATNASIDGWNGGRKARFRNFWNGPKGDADTDNLPDLPDMRINSRDLVRNNPLASGALNTKVTNVVGAGIIPQPKPDLEFLGMSDEQGAAWIQKVDREFCLWAESPDCSIERDQDFYMMQDLILRSMLENGDLLINLPYSALKNNPYALRVQLIEADRLCNLDQKPDGTKLESGNYMWAGVEKTRLGEPVAYYITDRHPGAMFTSEKLTWTRIKAFGERTGRRNILHVFTKKRIGQSRGLPDFAGVIEPLKQLQRYSEAEITAAVISAAFTVFVETEEGKGLDSGLGAGPISDDPLARSWAGGSYRRAGEPEDRDVGLAPGAIVDLRVGEKISTANPSRPNPAFDPFVQAVLRQVGTSLELPYEVVIKHFTASYSAARAALLEAWRYYLKCRSFMVSAACQPIYEAWLAEAVALGRIEAPGFFDDPVIRSAYCRAAWVGPGRGQINPLAETDAAIARIDSGMSTIEKESLEYDGSDFEMLHKQRVRETKKRVADKLQLAVDAEIKSNEKVQKQAADNRNNGDKTANADD